MSNTLGPHAQAAFEAWFLERYGYSRAVLTNNFWASEVKEALDAFVAGQAAERERIKVKLLARHDQSASLHNYYGCMAVELFGPFADSEEPRVIPNVQPAAAAR